MLLPSQVVWNQVERRGVDAPLFECQSHSREKTSGWDARKLSRKQREEGGYDAAFRRPEDDGGKTCMTEIELQGDSPTPRKDEERTSGWDHEARTNPDKIIAPSSFACSSWGLYLFAWKDNGGKTAKIGGFMR